MKAQKWDSQKGEKFLADSSSALFVAFIENQAVAFLTANRLQRFNKRARKFCCMKLASMKSF